MRYRSEQIALRMDEPYSSCDELLTEMLVWVDAALAHGYAHDGWVGSDPRLRDLMGLVVTREEFEEALQREMEPACEGAGEQAGRLDVALRARMGLTSERDNAYLRAVRRLGLDDVEERCLRLALAPELDEKYEKLYAYLQDDVSKRRPGALLCARLCGTGLKARCVQRIRSSRGLAVLMDAADWKEDVLQPGRALIEALFAPETRQEPQQEAYVALHEVQIERLHGLIEAETPAVVLLCGAEGSGRRTALRRASERPVVVCSQRETPQGAVRAALMDGLLCIEAQEGLEAERVSELPEGLLPVFVLTAQDAPAGEGMLRMAFEAPGDAEREALFAAHAQALGVELGACAPVLAAKFLFGPGRVRDAMQAAQLLRNALGRPLTERELHESCYERLPSAQGLTQETGDGFRPEDLILPAREKEQLHLAVRQVLLRQKVYEEWGLGEKTPYGRGISILLSGPPGTGKTMAARILAAQLNMRLRVVQLSQVISKYIGETEKNLQRVFEQGRLGSQVLFFDECDALFGKRAEVQNAQDRHANAEVAYLLQQMEAYDGVTILATNLSQNLDAAFMRRMRFVIHFPFPDAAVRRQLYERMLSGRAPVSGELDLDFMATTFEVAGGNIKNIVLRAAFLAADEGCGIGMKHLVRAAVDEQRKNEVVVVRETLKEYADLLGSND